MTEYIETDDYFYRIYEAYKPDEKTLRNVHVALPEAHVIVYSRRTCSDCGRHVPAIGRIAEHLPGWTWEVRSGEDRDALAEAGITHVPTFIVMRGENELGRIIENPTYGTLEADLLHISMIAE